MKKKVSDNVHRLHNAVNPLPLLPPFLTNVVQREREREQVFFERHEFSLCVHTHTHTPASSNNRAALSLCTHDVVTGGGNLIHIIGSSHIVG